MPILGLLARFPRRVTEVVEKKTWRREISTIYLLSIDICGCEQQIAECVYFLIANCNTFLYLTTWNVNFNYLFIAVGIVYYKRKGKGFV